MKLKLTGSLYYQYEETVVATQLVDAEVNRYKADGWEFLGATPRPTDNGVTLKFRKVKADMQMGDE